MRCLLLASGSGTLTQAVLDSYAHAGSGVSVVAVGSDKPEAMVLDRARAAGVETFSVAPREHTDRRAWNSALTAAVASYEPDWVVSAGFMRILGEEFVERFTHRIINTHPALLPSFPGAHGVREALAYGVKTTGTTIHLVDAGMDTGPIIAQFPVAVRDDDDEDTLHERIRRIERDRLVELLGHLATASLTVDGRHVRGWHPA